jgi:thymidylate synthase (FAD)
MIIVPPSATLEAVTPNALELIERSGRVCWKSEERIEPGSAERFITSTIMKKQHFSVLEHAVATWRFVCDRGVSHEMVRHRIASFSQESTRYCNYSKDKFGGQINVIHPPYKFDESTQDWKLLMGAIEETYNRMIARGEKPEIARSVLPNCLKTEVVVTANFREWMHIFDLRSVSPPAHPQIAEVISIAQTEMQRLYPCIFKELV